ncbi:MAG TPA: hypothetical protein VGM90_03255 [Kofleriaceae bacterium]
MACASKPTATRSSYAQKARHLSRLLGNVFTDELTRSHVERYIAARIREGVHTHTVHKELVVLRGALTSAEARDVFHGVIVKIVPRFRAQYVPRETYHTPEQLSRLLDHLVAPPFPNASPATLEKRQAMRVNRTLYVLITLASPRRGELERLDWRDINLAQNTIRIPKGKTKSRVVPIHPMLREWLEVLHEGTGRVITPWSCDKRELARACERANIPRVATWLKQSDVDSAVVSATMGHSSTAMVDRSTASSTPRTSAGPWPVCPVPTYTPVSRTLTRPLANMAR